MTCMVEEKDVLSSVAFNDHDQHGACCCGLLYNMLQPADVLSTRSAVTASWLVSDRKLTMGHTGNKCTPQIMQHMMF